ncbi:MAG: ABC transporter permease [Labilithrix sp.]|nr:ABC transporter permease [Labilithrix sp.]MCW5816389.1 ABC transporter permease [Labilithrix sp.]
MSLLETLRMAASALAANRGRSLLTVLSITIGAFAIVVMSSLAESGLNTLAKGIEDLGGARILLMWSKSPVRGQNKQFAYETGIRPVDRERIAKDLPHVEALSLYSQMGELDAMAESGLKARPSVIAGDAAFFEAFSLPLGHGRLFDDADNREHAPVCVVGKKLAEQVFPAPAEPVGSLLTIGALRCRVIGALGNTERFGVGFGFDWTDLVVVPTEAMQDVNPQTQNQAILFVKTDAASSNDIVKRLINARMEQRHPGVDDFEILDFSGGMKEFHMMFMTLELIVAVLAGIALFVGGVGVMNMMLVAVSERVTEIGLRKALGASPRTIGTQFLIESTLLSVFGGATGTALGIATATLASILIAKKFATWQHSVAPWAVLAALVVTFVIGVGFGWLPAKKAAGLDPVEAMRR